MVKASQVLFFTLLSSSGIQAQLVPVPFNPIATSLGPAPTESIGCLIRDGDWSCAAARQTVVSSRVQSTGTSNASPNSASSTSISPPPTESSSCVLHGDHYHCDEDHSDGTPTIGHPSIASSTQSSNCVWHEIHWDCFESPEEADPAHQADELGECIIHVGHTHGDCSAEQLACGVVLLEDYHMPLHIGSIFIVLITSGLGVLIPILTFWFRKGNDGSELDLESGARFGRETGIWGNVFFLARHFGSGIIMSTAFIHLLYHGFVMFANECVGDLLFESTAPAIAMAAAVLTFMLDLVGRRYMHSSGMEDTPQLPGIDKTEILPPANHGIGHGHHFDAALAAERSWQTLLLEAGIIFHSIMIGVTLGASSGDGWTTLLIVIVFHQFFEGSALGVRIALLSWLSKWKTLSMGLAFTVSCTVGIGIGIGVRGSFSQNGKASLLSVGILNSISAGILLYTAFNLLAEDFVNGPLRRAGLFKVVSALAAFFAGLVAMSVLGKWA
ncbi:ZIP zinc transporter-domain-containing protein [Kockovaella imperatae]|uniref:ZIP zinc transporter-domain-containing protein n=1 Tax=Kockovaella imperatae TaxID=4999 RepID=A0A1Y1UF52_9TREE|nr:ZIP zinc transporter-domain-containing protein [Kockovaella imperatae]ORX36144.1 ZIP zinc transporter-domain-containing protein [Kockovaella imperatae]